MTVSDAELAEFAERGFVTISSPFSSSELASATDALDAITVHDPDQGFEEEAPDGTMRPTGNHRRY